MDFRLYVPWYITGTLKPVSTLGKIPQYVPDKWFSILNLNNFSFIVTIAMTASPFYLLGLCQLPLIYSLRHIQHADIELCNSDGLTPLMIAAVEGSNILCDVCHAIFLSFFSFINDTHKLTFLCTITVNVKFDKFFMFTYWACCLFHWAVYTYILNIKVFIVLVVFTYVEVQSEQVLICVFGADPNKSNVHNGRTALHYATQYNHVNIVT